MDFFREIKKLYPVRKHKNFRGFVSDDLADPLLFFNLSEFAKEHEINNHKIIGVLINNLNGVDFTARQTDEENYHDITRSNIIFYCKKSDIKSIQADSSLKLNGKTYLVKQVQEVYDSLWRITLEENS